MGANTIFSRCSNSSDWTPCITFGVVLAASSVEGRDRRISRCRPLPELFAAAGAKFDVSEKMLAELVADIELQMA